uniref:Uncharacterized protein n=1 Tax=Rhizophora mucronata TaxID=61149 RepID=A0A2P2NPF1_RHIMU
MINFLFFFFLITGVPYNSMKMRLHVEARVQ